MREPYEQVHHPRHYALPRGLEVIDLAETMGFNLGNALKYLLRAGKKPGTSAETDLKKAVFYIERELGRAKPPSHPAPAPGEATHDH